MCDERDRTEEFLSIVKYIQETNNFAYGRHGEQQQAERRPSADSARLHAAASEVNKLVMDLKSKLKHLRKLANTNSLFNDPMRDFNQLTNVIKEGISQREAEVAGLVSFINSLDITEHHHNNYNVIISNLHTSLAGVTKEFSDILHIRSKTAKQQNARRKNFETDGGGHGATVRKRRAEAPKFVTDAHNPMFAPQSFHDQGMQQQTQFRQQDNYHQTRTKAAETVEATINEISKMMANIAEMIGSQKDMVVSIDRDLDDTLSNLEGGNSYLMQYNQRLSNSQWLIIKLFAIIIAISVFLIIFMK